MSTSRNQVATAEVVSSLTAGTEPSTTLALIVETAVLCLDAEFGVLLAHIDEAAVLIGPTAAGVAPELAAMCWSGPSWESARRGTAIVINDLDEMRARWPQFFEQATAAGVRVVRSWPMVSRNRPLGSLTVYRAHPWEKSPDVVTGQVLADLATLTLTRVPAGQELGIVADQLNTVLDGQMLLDQAAGMIAQHAGVDIHAAFQLLYAAATRHGLSPENLARTVTMDTQTLTAVARSEPLPRPSRQ